MIIDVPQTFIEERTYIIDVLFSEFLGLNYEIRYTNDSDYKIKLENNSELVIKDSFFSKVDEKDGYLLEDNIPSEIHYFTNNDFLVEEDIPVLYGTNDLIIKDKEVICGIDIFASSFFMLTRWEEYVCDKKDKHFRFPANESLAFKQAFLQRPIVNEYTEFLWNMLTHLGVNQSRHKNTYEFINTHDVDHIVRWSNIKSLLRQVKVNIISEKSVGKAIRNTIEFTQVKLGIKKDPYDTFDMLMELSEEVGIKSHFYFMSGGLTRNDNFYSIKSKKAKQIIDEIISRNHVIGFHPSYDAYKHPNQWKLEKSTLENVSGVEIKEGRQHYLRFEIPYTWGIWEKNNMRVDSTLGYADEAGFRCGTCNEFSVFDVIQRRRLDLKERPLIAMEVSLVTYNGINQSEVYSKIVYLLNKVKKYNGKFVFLWHNSSFNVNQWKEYDHIYKEIVSLAKKNSG